VLCSPSHVIPFDEIFDGIICTDVLEHVLEENIDETFRQIHSKLVEKGYVFLKIALKEENRRWGHITKDFGLKHLHVCVKNSKFWNDKFAEHGFQIVETLRENKDFLEVVLKLA
jgi:cyclopropane fatty-acyl-phospholipid synthase-like methyltransferase